MTRLARISARGVVFGLLGFSSILVVSGPMASTASAQSNATMGDCSPIVSGSNNRITCPGADTVAALINLDFEYLRRVIKNDDVWKIELALANRSVAQTFLSALKSARKNDFLGELMKANLSPNLLVSNESGHRESILVASFKAKNAEAMLALLKAGASPHGYQDIGMTSTPTPFFVFPHLLVQAADFFGETEKGEISKALIGSGLVMFDPPENMSYGTRQRRANEIIDNLARAMNISVNLKNDQCPSSKTAICKNSGNSNLYCNYRNRIPMRMFSIGEQRSYSDFSNINIKGFIGLYDGKAYYLATAPGNYSSTILLDYSADMRTISLKKYMAPGAGMGICRADASGYVDDYCWRSVSLTVSSDDKMMLQNFYEYKSEFCPQ